MQSDVFGGLAARFADIKKVLSYYESRVITENDSLPKRILYRGVNKLIKDMFVSTVVVSNGLKKEVEEEGFRPAGKVEVIHLGIEVPPEYASRSYSFHNLYNGEPVIGTISRFSFEKALDRFVEAAPFILKKVPGARFLLVGKGPDEDKLRTRIKELGLENKFEFREWTKDPFKTLEEIDIFFMSSLREGCPTALLEAMALRRPVVASDIEGVCDIVENGVNGILVNTADASAFGDAIIRLCEDPAAAVLMGQKGFATIRSSFIMGAEMNKIKNLYFNVLFGK
jgi:glycosyltransferase involved in cell wall biosynthesis